MRTTEGFDRLSTEEELHQVLAVLEELSRSAELWLDTATEDDAAGAESLAQLMTKRRELKN